MRIAGDSVGVRGLALLAVTAIVGIVLAVHGWSSRHHGLASVAIGGHPSGKVPATPTGSRSPHPTSPAPSRAGHSSIAGPSASPAPSAGPKLSSQSFASYTFQVWPGPPSQAAQAAETGLSITVHKLSSGISVVAAVAGQGTPPGRFYPAGARVYIIEASMGDDSGGSDFNLGDDGLVVTDSQGRILQ